MWLTSCMPKATTRERSFSTRTMRGPGRTSPMATPRTAVAKCFSNVPRAIGHKERKLTRLVWGECRSVTAAGPQAARLANCLQGAHTTRAHHVVEPTREKRKVALREQ